MSRGAALTPAHLERAVYVYIRQSSVAQAQTHVERQRPQYALSDHARELGFGVVEVIDEDLGIPAPARTVGTGRRRRRRPARTAKGRASRIVVTGFARCARCFAKRVAPRSLAPCAS